MNDPYKSIKIELVKEWLNQNKVSPKLLNHPRINEILDSIVTESNLIDFTHPEQRQEFTKKFRFLANGFRVYFPLEEKRTHVSWFDHKLIWSEDILKQKETKAPVRQIRIFDQQGIEEEYQIQRGNSLKKEQEREEIVWNQDITYQRDPENLLFWTKTAQYLDRKMTNYYVRKSGLLLQDLKINAPLLKSLGKAEQSLEDLSISNGKTREAQEKAKNMINVNQDTQELVQEYGELNQRYLFTRQYEKIIRDRLGIVIKEHD